MGPLGIEIMNGFDKNLPLETLRDNVRAKLHNDEPVDFPYGQVGTDLYGLVKSIFGKHGSTNTAIVCETCHNLSNEQFYGFSEYIQVQFWLGVDHNLTSDVQHCLALQLAGFLWCAVCGKASRGRRLLDESREEYPPVIIFVPLPDNFVVRISNELRIRVQNPINEIRYSLRGIIYHGSNHFTCRIIDQYCQCWNINGHDVKLLDPTFCGTTCSDSSGRKAAMAVYLST